jgi:membrane protein
MTERRRWRRAVNVPRAAGAALRRILRGGGEFVTRLYVKAGEDDIFFLAGGIAYNVVLAAVPFILMLVAVFGWVLRAQFEDPQKAVVDYVFKILAPSQQVDLITRDVVGTIVSGSTGFGVVGFLFFVWGSTALFGTLRAALRIIFDLPEERGIVEGKLFDLQMVVMAGTLFFANTGISVLLEGAQRYGVEWLGLGGEGVKAAQRMWAQFLAFAVIFVMFLLIYRYLPKRRTPLRMSLVAAGFAAVGWELLKSLFALYLDNAPNLKSTWAAALGPVVVVLWVYYAGVVFILGGEVAQVYDLLRVRRMQRELLE